ncbi:hypothetical protein SAMN02745120_1316 [Acetoanaerobium noterae]|uniref:Uncharacterized protein n=1 Tax=Acetoanaerobium noterae TaxID=745369 RepID=A0A1T5AZS8_9FIRM|nr:hypothetical protein SAMN02745120_1316 [Acetoanaerobium noterae]
MEIIKRGLIFFLIIRPNRFTKQSGVFYLCMIYRDKIKEYYFDK